MGKGRLGGEWSVGGLMEMGLAKFLIFFCQTREIGLVLLISLSLGDFD